MSGEETNIAVTEKKARKLHKLPSLRRSKNNPYKRNPYGSMYESFDKISISDKNSKSLWLKPTEHPH